MGGVPKLLLVAALGWEILGCGIVGQVQADDHRPGASQSPGRNQTPGRNQGRSRRTGGNDPREAATYVAMKPDPQGTAPGGGGFSFPDAMPSSLMDEAAKIREKIDQAGRTIEDRYNQTMGTQAAGNQSGTPANNARTGLVPPPSTRTSGSLGSNFAPPPFTGPTTDAGKRDNTWSAEAAARASAQAAQGNSQGSSTSANASNPFGFGSSANNSRASTTTAAGQASGFQNNNGLRSTDTFGRMPSSLAGSSPQTTNSSAAQQYAAQQYATQQEQVLADQRAAQQRQSQFGQTQPRQTSSASSRSTLSAPSYGDVGFGSNAPSVNPNMTPPSLTDATLYGRSTGTGQPNEYRVATESNPDSRLTTTQLQNNAWSVDDYNRIYDRSGRYMPNERLQADMSASSYASAGNFGQYPSGQQNLGGGSPVANTSVFGNQATFGTTSNDRFAQLPTSAATSPPSTGNPFPTPTTSGYPAPGFQGTGYPDPNLNQATQNRSTGYPSGYPAPPASISPSPTMSNADYDRLARLERENEMAEARRRLQQDESKSSQTDPQISTASVGSLGGDRPPQVAADSLFKLLLMISIFGNVYLAFWLKNMRIRFRDMVTTKRLTNSNASAT